jgi:hypothetical protein
LQPLPWQHLFLRLPGQPGECITRRRDRLRLQGPLRLRCGGTGLPVRQRASLGLSETRGDVPLLLSAFLLILTLAGCMSPPKHLGLSSTPSTKYRVALRPLSEPIPRLDHENALCSLECSDDADAGERRQRDLAGRRESRTSVGHLRP